MVTIRCFIPVVIYTSAFFTPVNHNLLLRAISFERHWDVFIRELFGCTLTGPTDAEHCNVGRGKINYREFKLVREEAMKLFELREP